MRERRNAIRTVAMLLGALCALVLAGCSSSAPPPLQSQAPVTANGSQYAYAGDVPSSQWPSSCSYLTVDSAAAAIGTDVSAKRFNTQCLYTPDSDDFPVLTIATIALGTDLGDQYDSLNSTSSGSGRAAVSGVGDEATFLEPGGDVQELNLLVRQGVFQLQLRSPAGNPVSAAQGKATLARVGKAIAAEFG